MRRAYAAKLTAEALENELQECRLRHGWYSEISPDRRMAWYLTYLLEKQLRSVDEGLLLPYETPPAA